MGTVGTSRQGTSSGKGDASIDIERLENSITEKLDKLSHPSPECCIYKVPKKLKKINEDVYTPLRVSIGHLHHEKRGLEDMEEHKLRYFKDFMERSGKSLKELVKIMKEKEKEIRKCYAETINLKSEVFLEIILVDAAFIIEVLLRYQFLCLKTPNDSILSDPWMINLSLLENQLPEFDLENDRIFNKPWMIHDIVHDLLLLENQLPLFILQHLFEMTTIDLGFNRNETMSYFIHLTLIWFQYENFIQKPPVLKDINLSKAKHFLDLLRSCLIPMKVSNASVLEEKGPLDSQALVPEQESPSNSQALVPEEESPSKSQALVPEEESPSKSQALVPEDKSPSDLQASVPEEKSPSVPKENSPSNSQALVPEEKSPSKLKQIIDCISHLIPRQSSKQRKFGIPSATELHKAGVKFKVSPSKNLFDINFNDNILEIPHMQINDTTERLLRNIIAYEQCHCDDEFFADYAMLMDYLIHTSKDVELLVQVNIIENWLSDNNDVSNFFNGLNKGVNIETDTYYFTELHKKLNDYYEIPCHKWKATLRQDYCNTPWRVLSISVAVILLGLTFIQSLCSLVTCNK